MNNKHPTNESTTFYKEPSTQNQCNNEEVDQDRGGEGTKEEVIDALDEMPISVVGSSQDSPLCKRDFHDDEVGRDTLRNL